MKKILFITSVISLMAFGCNPKPGLRDEEIIKIRNTEVHVQLADTPEKREQGLSGVERMNDDEGMLFLFSEPKKVGFWMRGMRFPIDIIWIQGDKIVGISERVPTDAGLPDSQLPLYYPPVAADKVLEVNSGWAFRHDVTAGDKITEIIKP